MKNQSTLKSARRVLASFLAISGLKVCDAEIRVKSGSGQLPSVSREGEVDLQQALSILERTLGKQEMAFIGSFHPAAGQIINAVGNHYIDQCFLNVPTLAKNMLGKILYLRARKLRLDWDRIQYFESAIGHMEYRASETASSLPALLADINRSIAKQWPKTGVGKPFIIVLEHANIAVPNANFYKAVEGRMCDTIEHLSRLGGILFYQGDNLVVSESVDEIVPSTVGVERKQIDWLKMK
jgi:hypothetical protein